MGTNRISKAILSLTIEKGQQRYKDYDYLLRKGISNPEMLYNYSDQISKALKCKKADILYVAIHLAAYISGKDNGQYFNDIFKDYFSLLNHESVVVAPHVAGLSAVIIKNNPQFEPVITALMLNLDKTAKCKNKELVKAYAINAFSEYFDISCCKNNILEFVKNHIKSTSPKARKASLDFLKIHE